MKSRYITASFIAALATSALAQDIDLAAGDTEGPDAAVGTEGSGGVFSHGYLRFGIGATDGDAFTAFKLNGAGAKYRLGNESDLYGEASLGYRAGMGNGSDFVAEVMLQGWADSNMFTTGVDPADGGGVAQAYAGLEKLGVGATAESFLWVGRRYYRRRDIHMNDFYYEDFSGDAIGLESLDLGNARLSTALFYNVDKDLGDLQTAAIDLRVHDIALGGGWKGEASFAWLDGMGDDFTGDDGYSLRFHAENTDLAWGEWKNAIQYGQGAGMDINSKAARTANSDDSRLRLVSHGLVSTSESFETQFVGIWERTEIAGDTSIWASAGIRPQYNFTDDWGVAFEAGYDWVDPEAGDSASLTKLTLAPFYSFGQRGYYARPQLRAFVTWADWSDEGAITDQAALGSSTSGTTYGIQLEQWW